MKHYLYIMIACLCVSLGVHAQRRSPEALRKLQMAEFAISQLYVDSVDEDHLVEEAIIKMLSTLDPHSTYTNAEEVKEMTEPLKGGFEGIGVQFQMIQDTLLVIQPVSGGPSEKVGILAGDRIVAVNDTAIAGVKMKTEEIMSRLRGPKGTTVALTIVRRGVSDPVIFSVKRDKIPIFSLDASYMIDDKHKIGYIRINRFSATTAEEFLSALKTLQKQGMRDLILDLQGNGGGYLNAAIDLANEFLGQGELIVYTEGRSSKRSDFHAQGDGHFRRGRLVVLVDEYSASASEIVSGAIQDWDRGVLVGRRTFGKGLVQRPIDLPDGSMIRLTVARYYTPAGRCIQKPYDNTANPDGTVKDADGQQRYNQELIDRLNHGELMHADSIRFPDSLKVATRRLGRTVYGGGGVMPDFFVPMDTARYSAYHRQLVAKGVVIRSIAQFIEHNRARLEKKYQKFDRFLERFEIDEEFLQQVRALADEEKIPFKQEEWDRSLPEIKQQLKALVARDIWDMNEYYRVMNQTDQVVQTGLRVLLENKVEEML